AGHVEALAGLFSQSVSIAMKDELVEMSDVAFDGTKVLANASKHKAMSYQRMCERVLLLHTEIEDLKEERRTVTGRRKEEIERDLEFKRRRLGNLQEQKFALEDQHAE